jgi:hypothetical protein
MAIAAAAAAPDLLSGVIAVGGFLPIVPGWDPPLAPLDGLPVLLIDDPTVPVPAAVLAGERLVETLREWGADVTHVSASDPLTDIPAEAMSRWIAARAARTRTLQIA